MERFQVQNKAFRKLTTGKACHKSKRDPILIYMCLFASCCQMISPTSFTSPVSSRNDLLQSLISANWTTTSSDTSKLDLPLRDDAHEKRTFNEMTEYWNKIKGYVNNSNNDDGNLQTVATALGSLFQKFVEEELAGKKTVDYYNSLQYEGKRAKPIQEQVGALSDLIATQLRDYLDALDRMSSSLKISADEQSRMNMAGASVSEISSCCELKSDVFEFDKYFNTHVSKREACKTVPSKRKPSMFIPNHAFNKVLLENANRLPHLKWQYFVTPDGVSVEYPANSHNCNKSNNVNSPQTLNSKGPSGKKLWLIQKSKDDTRNQVRIVFLLQLGKDTTLTMIKSIRNIVLLLLRFLDETDEVGIVNSEADLLWSDFLCDQMVPVTSWTRYQIMSYLSYIESKFTGATESEIDDEVDQDSQVTTSGIQKAINMACANFSSDTPTFPPTASTIIHLRSGIKFDGFKLKSFRVNCPIFIDTFFLRPLNTTDEENYKRAIQGVTSKNVWRVQVFSTSLAEPESFAVKVALKLNSKKEWWSLTDILSQFFPKQNENYSKTNEFSFPHWNPLSKEAVIIAKKYVFHAGKPLGLVAVEIPLTYFTQHVTYFVNENTCDGQDYAFLIDKQGRVLAHPALGRPDLSQDVLSPMQIDQIEVHYKFSSLKRKMLLQERGCESLILRTKKSVVTYAWSVVNDFDYIAVLVFHGTDNGCASYKQEFFLKKAALNSKANVQHHRLLKETQYCYEKQVTLTKASLYLAPNAFTRPADIISPQFSYQVNTKQPLALMAFLGDNSGLLKNQNRGLKPMVKDHVAALSNSVTFWQQQFFNSDWNKHILRRFGTGAGGTFLLVFPGSVVTNGYLPSSTKWFRLASSGGDKISFTPTMVDGRSGIPISTISHVVSANINSTDSRLPEISPIAVLGADVNVGFFQKLLENIMPDCGSKSSTVSSSKTRSNNGNTIVAAIRCFLVDESGYVVYHPFLTKSLKTNQKVHLTQLEPLTVIDILQYSQNNHGVPMQKQMCHKLTASATQGSLQRIYVLKGEGVQRSKHAEQCSRYAIVRVPGTNLFLFVVHDACHSSAAFCPCSLVDKLCLNCLRMDPSDCECPCQCPREPSFCSLDESDLPEDVEPCEFPEEELSMVQEVNWNCSSTNMSTTTNYRCNSNCTLNQIPCHKLNSPDECIGSWDCEWCVETTNNNSNNSKNAVPMCKTYKECYGYSTQKQASKNENYLENTGNDGFSGSDMMMGLDRDDDDTGSTLLPALGVLSVFVVFLGLVVYCYRHRALNSSNSQPDLHLLPLQESPRCSIVPQAGSSRSDSDAELFQVPIPLPIAVGSRGRRRQNHFAPPRSPAASTVTESDHGYSTMTPHNEDASSIILIDPPLLPRAAPEPQEASEPLDFAEDALPMTQVNRRLIVPVTVHEPIL